MDRVFSHAKVLDTYTWHLGSKFPGLGAEIGVRLAELKKEQAKEQEALKIERQAQKVVELAKAARSAIKRKHDGNEVFSTAEITLSRLHQHAESITAACKKLKYD